MERHLKAQGRNILSFILPSSSTRTSACLPASLLGPLLHLPATVSNFCSHSGSPTATLPSHVIVISCADLPAGAVKSYIAHFVALLCYASGFFFSVPIAALPFPLSSHVIACLPSCLPACLQIEKRLERLKKGRSKDPQAKAKVLQGRGGEGGGMEWVG